MVHKISHYESKLETEKWSFEYDKLDHDNKDCPFIHALEKSEYVQWKLGSEPKNN
jgi:hypothetical protein